jgi:DNA polymerase-1
MQAHPLPGLILQYRELNKLKNTYVDQLPTFVNPDSNRIHSSFRQTVAATGRLASDNPNLQNIPIRTEEGRRIRNVFVPSDSNHVLVSADYSQIELRVVAHFSKDPTFMAAYRQNLDIHALTAATIFEVAEDQVTREMRTKAKEVNFGLIYRMGPERLSLITHTSKTEAKGFIERYFQKYATIHTLQEHFLEQARKEGYAQTLMGRRRYLPAINGRGLHRRMAEGAAVNTPIQGTAAEIIKLAMTAIQKRLQRERLKTKMILSVHDELVFDTPHDEETIIVALVKQGMEQVITLEVPLVVEVGVGVNWLEAH